MSGMVSFIVPAHNEEQLIARTLDAIQAAARELSIPFELIVVDDASSDGTAAIASAHGARVVPVTVPADRADQEPRRPGRPGRHLDLRGCRYRGADGHPAAALAALAAGAVGGGATVTFDGRVPFWGAMLLPIVRGMLRVGNVPAGCFVFCARVRFEAVGGFDERLYAGEEIAFGRALRRLGRLVILHEIVVTSGRKLRTHTAWKGCA